MELFSTRFSLFALLGAFLVGVVVGRLRREDPRHALERQRADNKRAQTLLRGFQSLDHDKRAAIEGLMRSGRKIEAIRDVRMLLDCGLKDAKDLVESLDR